jgi:hypothetical protein
MDALLTRPPDIGVYSAELGVTHETPRDARLYVTQLLTEWAAPTDLIDAAMLLTSELVTNAITHAGGATIGLEVMHLGGSGAISVIVADASPRPPVMRAPDDNFEHWRGLNIVAALSARWGWTPQGTGKSVYAILAREA